MFSLCMSFVLEIRSLLKKRLLIFCMEGLLQMMDYYQFFLITMAGIALFFYIQHAGKPTKRNKWKFLIIVFLFYLLNYLFLKSV